MLNQTIRTLFFILLLMLIIFILGSQMGSSSGPPPQPAAQVYNDMQTIYLGNLERRNHGLPPLRWNAQLADAARWFSWDSVENRSIVYCGHQDTLGRWAGERVATFGYQGVYGVENVICGYTTPELAIQTWMANSTHHANLLNSDSWEASAGYYRRDGDGPGYVTYDLGQDPTYPPLVIENEALNSVTSTVQLYIYDRESDDASFARLGRATEMRVSNDAYLIGASWEPFANEKNWSLEPGTGWRSVYVQSRDAVGRVTTVSDTIYLGPSAPQDELDLRLAASNSEKVTLYQLDSGGLPQVQFSHNWFVDDTHPQFACLWGNCGQVNDSAALGGTATRLFSGAGQSEAWVWTTDFIQDAPLVAYFRLKVSDNTSTAEVAQVSVQGGGATYGPLALKGTDFDAAGVYQDFSLAFNFHTNPDNPFLIFDFKRSGQADVYVDGVYIFSAPMPVQSPLTWTVPGGNYRGGGVWLRYSDDAGTFSAIQQADLIAQRITVSPASLFFTAQPGATLLLPRQLAVLQMWNESFDWNVSDDAGWLQAQPVGETIQVSADASGLGSGLYQAVITVQTQDALPNKPVLVPVLLLVSTQLHQMYLPLVLRAGP
jgi:uncharacterized protein YkwD